MIRIGRAWVLLAWVLALLIPARASAARPEVPEILAPVTDLAGVLPESAEAQISGRLQEHREATGVQIAVLTVRTTGRVPIEDYALLVAMQWGGGSKEADDGALYVLAVDDRQMRLELGYGLEAKIPDAQARRLLDAAIPHLRREDYATATHTVVEGVVGMTGGTSRASEPIVDAEVDPMESWTPVVELQPRPSPSSTPFQLGFSASAFFVLFVGIALGFVGVVVRQRADARQLQLAATNEEEGRIDDLNLPPLGKHVLVLIAIVVAVGAVPFGLGFGVATFFSALIGGTLGYLILPAVSSSSVFSPTGTDTCSGSSSRTWWSRSSSSSFGGSSFRFGGGGSSSRSWSGGGGRFGGGGASSRW